MRSAGGRTLHPLPGAGPRGTLAGRLGRTALLVLDNLEHLLAAALALDAFLAACPDLTILAISREPLHLRREQVVEVPPLPVPAPAVAAAVEDLAATPTVALFVERARAASPAFALTVENAAVVADVCRRLDGLPLAIELAAGWTRVLPPAALLVRLGDRLLALSGGPSDLPARQRTMRDAIAWSHDLLDPAKQRVFRPLAVFMGGFGLDAAERVDGQTGWPADGQSHDESSLLSVLDDLAALVDHSLVQQVAGPAAEEPRYRLLETVREYALERLEASGEEDAVRRRHAAHVTDLAEQLAERIWLPPASPAARFLRMGEGARAMPRCGITHRDHPSRGCRRRLQPADWQRGPTTSEPRRRLRAVPIRGVTPIRGVSGWKRSFRSSPPSSPSSPSTGETPPRVGRRPDHRVGSVRSA